MHVALHLSLWCWLGVSAEIGKPTWTHPVPQMKIKAIADLWVWPGQQRNFNVYYLTLFCVFPKYRSQKLSLKIQGYCQVNLEQFSMAIQFQIFHFLRKVMVKYKEIQRTSFYNLLQNSSFFKTKFCSTRQIQGLSRNGSHQNAVYLSLR